MPRHRYFPKTFQQTLVPSSARTSSGNGSTFTNLGPAQVAELDVTAVSGTNPTLAVVIKDSPNGSVWTTRASFTTATGTGTEVIRFPPNLDANVRAEWTIGGTATPSFTFSVQVANATTSLV